MHLLGADVNLVWLLLLLMTVGILFAGFLVNYVSALVPGPLLRAFRYGKANKDGRRNSNAVSWIGKLEVMGRHEKQY